MKTTDIETQDNGSNGNARFTAYRGTSGAIVGYGATRKEARTDLLAKEAAVLEETATFETSEAAWAFMRECQGKGWSPGYPSLKAPYTVRYYRLSEAALLARADVKASMEAR